MVFSTIINKMKNTENFGIRHNYIITIFRIYVSKYNFIYENNLELFKKMKKINKQIQIF